MKKLILSLVVILLSVGGCTTTPSLPDPDLSMRSTVRLIAEEGPVNGSVIVLQPGLVLTAGHVADVMQAGRVLFIEPQHIQATVLRKSKYSDLALLSAPGVICPCAQLAESEPKIDDILTIIGFPLNAMIKGQVLTQGRFQGFYEDKMTHSINAAPGNSGGGVFKDGKLVGVLIEGFSEFNYLTRSVRLQVIKEFING